MHEQIYIYHIGPTDHIHPVAHIYMKKSNTLMNVGFYHLYFPVKKETYALIRDYTTTFHDKYSDTAKAYYDDWQRYSIAFFRDTTLMYQDSMRSDIESQKYFKELRDIIPNTKANMPLIYYLSTNIIRDKNNTEKEDRIMVRKTMRVIKRSVKIADLHLIYVAD